MGNDGSARRFDHLRLGVHGEDLAERWYRERGYQLLDRNWRCSSGELDLVLRGVVDDRQVIVFCEVKTRSSRRYGTPFEAVGRDKQRRIRRLAVAWLVAHEVRAPRLRFDVAGVSGGRIEVIQDAF